ncbi:hypothetical protein Kpol_1052p24 [Vanderwaltozyma polyspora DSM 70294]|uniref:Protein MUM2 n=1 Tax=Vanderwaltozyma polyspora (strain ATCC 22028 / DSM 70294 / BCRC 21397 / CBS 2163 / NBRC 10782 / NRRL Y-8283 / UCD 57-17) TaxID=436907 RepID=A7TM35_VANPO|nr:uncharacterized protein Kpol_1052p24 [Vanderwaltozyma polyspora DSM 70294]EDO16677.1 hypothetical protein Kpol_1052p24 [Vanderwaltozyma polyspora DSM 70294]
MNYMNYNYDRPSLDNSFASGISFNSQLTMYDGSEKMDNMIKNGSFNNNSTTNNNNNVNPKSNVTPTTNFPLHPHQQMNTYQYYNNLKGNLTGNNQEHLSSNPISSNNANIWRDQLSSSSQNGDDNLNVMESIGTSTAGNLTSNKSYVNPSINTSYNSMFDTYSNTTESSNINQREIDEELKLLLQVKETQIESLENEIQKLKGIFKSGFKNKNKSIGKENINNSNKNNGDKISIPSTLENIFRKLSVALHDKEQELAVTMRNLESVLTAVAAEPSNSITKYGRYDIESLSHKIIVRIETLTKENREMSKMLAYGRSKETQIELQLVKKENDELKDQIRILQQQHQKSGKQKKQ